MKSEIECEGIPIFDMSFSTSIWKNSDKINFLLRSIKNIENKVEKYLGDITKTFPNLTDHSITHSKMLWNYANIIIGDQKRFLNPMEAFVLHCVFLIHDSGMCYSILDNKEEIEKDPIYLDFISSYGGSGKVKEDAMFYTIRQRHGEYAFRAATDRLGNGEYLIEDVQLREELGEIIGKIAKSHTCELNYIEREFGAHYITPSFPTSWSINCQKMALVLRTADAAHIDNLRTPKTNRMIDKMKGVSAKHWTFQKKLGFPHRSQEGFLVYSTNSPFTENQQKAWWFCYDALKVLDKEIKKANEYLELNREPSFQVRGVKGIDDTLLLGDKYVRTRNWKSMDTNIKVRNPVHIASELGGEKLYGASHFAIRELIQNSIDAINLHRVYTDQENNLVGEIKVSLIKNESDFYLTIVDNGIGMSRTLMTEELLDFGGSYWKSARFQNEYQGLRSRGFQSIGKFGIGFFSSFMLGNRLTVTSWKYGVARNEMYTLDFYDGLWSTPLLRKPNDIEKSSIIDRGTMVSIKLALDPYENEGFIGKLSWEKPSLYNLIKYHIPSPNVKITIYEENDEKKEHSEILPNAMGELNYKEIIEYLFQININSGEIGHDTLAKALDLELIDVVQEGKTVGRLSLAPNTGPFIPSHMSVVISNGIRINQLGYFVGYLIVDDVITISRNEFKSQLSFESLKKWAIAQRALIAEKGLEVKMYRQILELEIAFSLNKKNYPILVTKKNNSYGHVLVSEFRTFLKENQEVKLHMEGYSQNLSADCDGFLYIRPLINFKKLLKDSDRNQIQDYYDLIEEIIFETWGDYKKSKSKTGGFIFFEEEYLWIDTYKKTNK